MIVFPVKIFDIRNDNSVSLSNTMQNSNVYITKPYSMDKVDLSFTGFFENATEPVRLDQAQEISGIHCPVCGVRMLSQKDYEKILQQADKAENAQDFINILKDNQKYLPKHLRKIIVDSEYLDNPEKMSIRDYYCEMNQLSYHAKQLTIHNIKNELKEYLNWLGLSDKQNEHAHNIVSKIHTKQNYNIYKEIIDEYIDFLKLHDDKANEIKMKTLKPVVIANDYYLMFHVLRLSKMTDKEIAHSLAEFLFSKSVNTINPMDRIPQHEGHPNNKVLICKNCNTIQNRGNFLHDIGNPKIKDYIDTYLADIAYLIGHNKMEQSNEYISAFCHNVMRITKGKIYFSDNEIKSLKNLQQSASRHEIFAPIQQSKTDIPCAECGSILLTHEMRIHIEEEMKDCKTLRDYSMLLDKYDKYVGKYARPYVNMFQSTIKEYPNISNEKFLEIFQGKADRFAERRLKKEYEDFKQYRSYYANHGSPEQLKNYDLFRLLVKDYINSEAYLDNELITYYTKCLEPLNLEKAPVKAIYAFTTTAKQIILAHRITSIENKISKRKEDPIYSIVFNMFKMNVATADHLIATSKGGDDSVDNLIALCKTCNKIKSKKDVRTWIIDNKRVKNNIANQMLVIDNMAKYGEINGFDNWASNISDKLYKLTEGKIDLREEFKK